MNIGFDASRSFNKNRTGTENYSYQILKHLIQVDHTNNYYIYTRPVGAHHDAPEKRAIHESPLQSNVKFINIPYRRLWTQVGLAHQTFKDKLDVLFVPAHTLPLIRKPGLKTVVTVHDLGAEFLPKTHQLKQRAYLKFMTDVQLKSATHLIAVSTATKDDLIKKVKISPTKISVIYEGYDKNLFKPLKTDELSDTLNKYEIESNNYFLFVGTIQPRKNLERLIAAYALFLKQTNSVIARSESTRPARHRYLREMLRISKQTGTQALAGRQSTTNLEDRHGRSERPRDDTVKLVLAGSKGWLSDEIYELPKKHGIEKEVKFLGYVPDENLPALYNGATALLFPSLFEGFGLPILEAMACGCPVLTSNLSSMPEIAGDSAILVDPYSIDGIAQGISRLNSDQKLRNELKIKGITQSKKFSWENCAQETLEILTSITI